MFTHFYGTDAQNPEWREHLRIAVRGIVRNSDGQLLMIRTGAGEYKFPGGGMEQGESFFDTLVREVREESGYHVVKIETLLGIATERRTDLYQQNTYFVMESRYMLCEVDQTTIGSQQLDHYEKELQMHPVWVEPAVAAACNQTLLQHGSLAGHRRTWLERDTNVLTELMKKENS